MDVYLLINLYLSTFGLLSFSFLLFLQLKDWRDCPLIEMLCSTALTVVSILWFVMGLLITFPVLRGDIHFFSFLGSGLGLFFPPLINAAFYFSYKPNRAPRWFALGGIFLSVAVTLAGLAAIGLSLGERKILGALMGFTFQVSFVWVAVYSASLIYLNRRAVRNARERRYRKRMYQLLGLLALFTFLFYVPALRELGGLLARSMPLLFAFFGLYYRQQYEFFDLAIKRGLFFFLVFGLLLAYFAAILPLAEGLGGPQDRSLILTLLALPPALALPYFYRRLEAWLDRIWLGRLFSPVDAAGHFLSGVRQVTSEQELLKQAGKTLGEIFQARVQVLTGPDPPSGDDSTTASGWGKEEGVHLEIPIQAEGRHYGVIRLGGRPNQTPYFKSDRKLLTTLADILARLMEYVRLQERHRLQERREEGLRLQASQSELKALRAQINPHFLFNALNAIAGLIHKHPQRAEQTVERLAEVFRYTLSRSEQEWVRLESEMEFIAAYLEVERSRFGKRLLTNIDVEDETRNLWIPSMLVQTLVENAVKHGLSSVRGVGRIHIRTWLDSEADRLRIQVSDNGSGFGHSTSRRGAGFGLPSIRRRLEGYFDGHAQLRAWRDEEARETMVQIEMPVRREVYEAARPEQGSLSGEPS